MAEITSIIKNVSLTYCETTGMGSPTRSFVAAELPKVKGELFLDHSTSLAIEGQMLQDEADELSTLLERVAIRLTEEIRATLSQA
jgi:hypothetical protein